MTVLVAARTPGGETWIGSDLSAFQGDMRLPTTWQKWTAAVDGANVVWFAISGDAVLTRMLARRFERLTDRTREGGAVRLTPGVIGDEFVAAIADLAERNKAVDDKASPGTLIAVLNNAIYSYDKLGAWDEHADYISAGSGREHALGALYAMMSHHPVRGLSGSLLVESAVRAACEFNAWCRGCWVQKVWG